MPTYLKVLLAIYFASWFVGYFLVVLYKLRFHKVAPEIATVKARNVGGLVIAGDWAGAAYLLKREYRSVGDEDLSKAGDRAWWAGLIFLFLFAAVIALFVVQYGFK